MEYHGELWRVCTGGTWRPACAPVWSPPRCLLLVVGVALPHPTLAEGHPEPGVRGGPRLGLLLCLPPSPTVSAPRVTRDPSTRRCRPCSPEDLAH